MMVQTTLVLPAGQTLVVTADKFSSGQLVPLPYNDGSGQPGSPIAIAVNTVTTYGPFAASRKYNLLSSSGVLSSTMSVVDAPQGVVNVIPGASPYVYKNTQYQNCSVFISGGTVSAIAISRDGVTYYVTGQIAGMFNMSENDYLKVTYSVVPTVFSVFPR
jgi:hypothetical protein